MKQLLTGIPLLLTLLVYYKSWKYIYMRYGSDILNFKTQELHKNSQGLLDKRPFYENWLFDLPQRIPAKILIYAGVGLFVLSWFLG